MALITLWNNPRPNKRLLVLDIYKILAHYELHEPMIRGTVNIRKHLMGFLMVLYKYYDFAVWSSTSLKYILKMLKALNMFDNKYFKLLFVLDSTHLTPATTTVCGIVKVKALSVIWDKFEQFDEKNTIIVDYQELHFCLNPKNGLKIKPYHKKNHGKDTELFILTKYLITLAKTSTNFSQADIKHWESYVS